VLGQLAGGDQAGDRGRGDGLALLIDEEAPVGVPVERQVDLGAGLGDLGLQSRRFFGSRGLASW
jgi:hypothetical protein